jgi:NAD(P)-dependent dehydrogenase (short-subunit alcohol dehydrogenase family)
MSRPKRIVITGAGRGIGRAIACALANTGASVTLLARSADQLAETADMIGNARTFPGDIVNPEYVRATFAEIGEVDLLVNNAGSLGPLRPFTDTDPAEWWRAMEVNMLGPVLTTRAVLPGMIARRRGRIINIASAAGIAARPYFSSYVTSKTALIRFTECIALEARESGVTAFAISPGTVRTAMSELGLHSPDGQRYLPWFQKMFDDGLDVPPERAANLVLALASGKADSLTGRFIGLTDDLDLLIARAAEIDSAALYCLRLGKLPDPHMS